MLEDAYVINGAIALRGNVKLSGAKNVALKVLIASLLMDGKVIIKNIPRILDIEELLGLINFLGGRAKFIESNTVEVDGSTIKKSKIDFLHASKIRVSFMMFAPLLYKFGQAKIPNPGGCRIGARPINRQISVMESLGIGVSYRAEDGYYYAHLKKTVPQGSTFSFEKPSHTGTEFALMLGSMASDQTVIENASLEPEIDELIDFLNICGANIKRVNKKIVIKGVKKLKQKKDYQIGNDRNEAVTYAAFALATKGDIKVEGIDKNVLEAFLDKVADAGGGIKVEGKNIRFFYKGPLRGTDVVTSPHPGFMTDWQAPWAILMTQAKGISTIHETVFENRFGYVGELAKLGARIEFFKPEEKSSLTRYQFNTGDKSFVNNKQAIRIHGETTLHNGVLEVSDLRAGASLLIAAAVAGGESIVMGASVIDRGYENIDKKLKLLGADIKKS